MAGLRVEIEEGVCRAVLDEPDKLNPLSPEVLADLEDLVWQLEDDAETRVVVFSGAGRAFSAGADLRPSGDPPSPTWAGRRREAGRWQRVLDALERVPQVTVASLHGRVIGGAVVLATTCDLRIAADDALFSIPELALGIPLTWAGLPRLVREIGLPRTRDLVMTGRVVDATGALEWGLVTRLVGAELLALATDDLVDELLAMPDAPLRMTREALAATGRQGMPAAWADADLLAWSLTEPESREAARSYRRTRLSGRSRQAADGPPAQEGGDSRPAP